MKVYRITYISYNEYADREVYWSESEAIRRYKELSACPVVSNLKLDEIHKIIPQG